MFFDIFFVALLTLKCKFLQTNRIFERQMGFSGNQKTEGYLDQHVFHNLTSPLEEICLYPFHSTAAVLCARAGQVEVDAEIVQTEVF